MTKIYSRPQKKEKEGVKKSKIQSQGTDKKSEIKSVNKEKSSYLKSKSDKKVAIKDKTVESSSEKSEKKETLGQASVKRRRGIFIVKKKRPKVEPVTEAPPVKKSEIGKENRVIAAVDETIAAKKARKKVKKNTTST